MKRKRTSRMQIYTTRIGLICVLVVIVLVVMSMASCRQESPELTTDAGVDEQDVTIEPTPCTQLTLQAASTWGVSLQFIVHCRYGADGRTCTVVSELEAPMSLVDTPAYQECTRPGQVLFSAELCDLANQEQLEYIRGW